MPTIDKNGNSLYRIRYVPGVREPKVLLELPLRLALPSEELQLLLQEQPWQLLKASFTEFQVRLPVEVDRLFCLHHFHYFHQQRHYHIHQQANHLLSVGLIRRETLKTLSENPVLNAT